MPTSRLPDLPTHRLTDSRLPTRIDSLTRPIYTDPRLPMDDDAGGPRDRFVDDSEHPLTRQAWERRGHCPSGIARIAGIRRFGGCHAESLGSHRRDAGRESRAAARDVARPRADESPPAAASRRHARGGRFRGQHPLQGRYPAPRQRAGGDAAAAGVRRAFPRTSRAPARSACSPGAAPSRTPSARPTSCPSRS